MTLDPVKFERSILIKNNDGDWGIALGQWSGFRRGSKLNNMSYWQHGSVSSYKPSWSWLYIAITIFALGSICLFVNFITNYTQ